MRTNFKRALTGAGSLALASGLVLAASGVASATTTSVGWEPDPNSIGTITLLNSSGAPITGGSLDGHPLAAYAIASHAGRSGDSKAQLYVATPVPGSNPQTWSSDVLSAGTYSPVPSGTPSAVSTPGLPFVTGGSTDLSMNDYIGEYPNNLSTSGYQNLYQLRIYTSGTGQPPDTTQYDTLDIQVNPSADTWQVVYPASGTYPDATDTTTTTLHTSPTSPDTSSNNPESVTLNASVSAASAVPSSYTGPIGTVTFFDGATQVGTTQLVSGSGPYTASVTDSVANPSTHSFTAQFAPYIGTSLTTSTSATVPFSVAPPAPATSTDLSVTPGQYAGDQNSYVATVDYGSASACTGTVNFYDDTTKVAGPISPKPGTPNEFDATNTFNSPGSHSITAVFSPSDATVCATSTSAASTFSQSANPNGPCASTGSQCTDVQNIEATIPQGVLSITTPYSNQNPLNLGTMHLDSTGTVYSASATFGGSATDPTQDIYVTDTRAGDLPWTAQAAASTLSDGGSNAGSQISGEDVGLTGLTEVPVSGNGFNGLASNFTTFANPAAYPAVAPTDLGTAGLGNGAHDIAQAQQGIGSIGLTGLLTLNAPSSTEAGLFTGTITFTLVGSLV
ncbi:MAG TPA: Ig-like domain-containing protein [Mycobacteriales bacterium]|nr:Ig-like domain-containing protein [Mycobacteriales bacterium]